MNRCGVQGDTGWGGSPLGSSDVRGRETETINSLNSEWSSWADTSVFVASLLKVTILREQQRQRGSLILNLLTKGGLGFHCTCQSLRSSSVYSCKQRLEETGAQRILDVVRGMVDGVGASRLTKRVIGRMGRRIRGG